MTDPGKPERSAELELTTGRKKMLSLFVLATVVMIPLNMFWPGLFAAGLCLMFAKEDPEPAVRRKMPVLLGCVVLLGATNINTSLTTRNFLEVGIPFLLVVVVPWLILRKTAPDTIRFRFFPKKIRRVDVIYTIISIPLAWAILEFYWWVNPELYQNWPMAPEPDPEQIRRLFIGINLVGIWDELFFVNTVFAVLRSLFRYPVANAVQAVVYTSVLFDMAFTGIGPLIVYAFAWTQGAMFEKSESLIWVLIVHLIVDFFLVAAIVSSHYPDYGFDFLWRHGM